MFKEENLTIIKLNDVYGHILPHNEVSFNTRGSNVKKAGSYSRIKTIVDNIKKKIQILYF